jgi:hypothetical protein
MNLARDSILALQRHFLGALSTPAHAWLVPLPAPRLAFAGSAVRTTSEGCVLDFDTVELPAEAQYRLRISNPGAEGLLVRLAERPPWLSARFAEADVDVVVLGAGDPGATIELTIVCDEERELTGALRFVVDSSDTRRTEELPVRMTARRTHPVAELEFNGGSEPHTYDFGSSDEPYHLSVANRSSVPLVVAFSDLPAWLTFEVDGVCRSGPAGGRFFERTAPFTATIKPHLLGRHYGAIRIATNDPRPELRTIELRFSACMMASKPFVRAFAPQGVRLRTDQTATIQARLENWGRFPARMTRKALPKSLRLPELPVVPAAIDGNPGMVTLPIRILPAKLAAGRHRLSLMLRVEGGDPAEVDVPVHVEVLRAMQHGGRIPTEMIAVLVTLLLLTFLFVFIVRGLP